MIVRGGPHRQKADWEISEVQPQASIPVARDKGMIAVALAGMEPITTAWIGFIELADSAVGDKIVTASDIHDRLKTVRIESIEQPRGNVYEAGPRLIRPCVMTTVTTLVAPLNLPLSDRRGADVARVMMLPVFGGVLAEPFNAFVVLALCCRPELKLRLDVRDGLSLDAVPTSEGTNEAA